MFEHHASFNHGCQHCRWIVDSPIHTVHSWDSVDCFVDLSMWKVPSSGCFSILPDAASPNAAKSLGYRVLVNLQIFKFHISTTNHIVYMVGVNYGVLSGRRWTGDVHYHLEDWARRRNVAVTILSMNTALSQYYGNLHNFVVPFDELLRKRLDRCNHDRLALRDSEARYQQEPDSERVGRAHSVQRPACLGAHLVDIFLWIIIANALTSESGLAVESVPVFSLVNSDLPDDAIMMVWLCLIMFCIEDIYQLSKWILMSTTPRSALHILILSVDLPPNSTPSKTLDRRRPKKISERLKARQRWRRHGKSCVFVKHRQEVYMNVCVYACVDDFKWL